MMPGDFWHMRDHVALCLLILSSHEIGLPQATVPMQMSQPSHTCESPQSECQTREGKAPEGSMPSCSGLPN